MKNLNEKVLDQMVEMVEGGSTRQEVGTWLVNELQDFGLAEKYLRSDRVKFKRSAGNWDSCIEYFDQSDEPTKDGLKLHLEEYGLTETQAKKYVSSYFYVLNEVYKLTPSS